MDVAAIDELKKALEPVFDKLGQGLAAGWAIMIKMAYAHAIELLIGSFLLLVSVLVLSILAKKFYKKATECMVLDRETHEMVKKHCDFDPDDNGWAVATLVTIIGGGLYAFICVPISICNIVEGIKILIFPEVWVLQYLMSLVK